MKQLLIVILVLSMAGISSADYAIGPTITGAAWSGNSTEDNTINFDSTDNVYLHTKVDSGLTHWWPIEKGSGTTAYDEVGGDDATINGGTWNSSGVYGWGIDLDGSVGGIDTGVDYDFINFTLIAWARYNDFSTYPTVCYNHVEYYGSTISSTRYKYDNRNATTDYAIDNSSLDLSTWVHFAHTRDNATGAFILYVDKSNSGSGTIAGPLLDITNNYYWGAYGAAGDSHLLNGTMDDLRIYDRVLTTSEITQVYANDHKTTGNQTMWHNASSGHETYRVIVNCSTPTNTNYTVYYRQNNTGNYVSLASAQTGNQTITISGTKYRDTDVRVKLRGNTTETPELFGVTFGTQASSAAGAPNITSYAPTGNIWPEVADSQLFNITVNQTTQCRWYVNGTLRQTNSTPSLTHAYTNTSLPGGGCNVTASANNTNGTDTKTWEFEVGADSISYTILSEDDTNLTYLIRWDVTRIGSNVTHWNTSYSNTTSGCTYYKNFDNDTEILNQTAAADDETLWFNSSTLLPTGIYYINGSCPYNYITLYANEYALVNNWTTDQTYQQINNNISNAKCYSYYNSTSGLWEAYRAGYTYNHDATIPKNCSVVVYVDAKTTINATQNTGGITITQDTWFYGYLPGSTAKTLTQIKTAMDAAGLDVWNIYAFNNSSQTYTSTGSYSVAPNEGYAVYCNVTGGYTP